MPRRLTHSTRVNMDNNDQSSETTAPLPDTSFSFTPVRTLRPVPRLWDRKPSTPFRTRPKTRKLWKRFHSTPSTGMMSLHSSAASQETVYARGVKRLCLDAEDGRTDRELEQTGQSFLETKWELEARKRRKLPDAPIAIHNDNLQTVAGNKHPAGSAFLSANHYNDVGGDKMRGNVDGVKPQTLQAPVMTTIYNDTMDVENLPTDCDENTTADRQSGLSSPGQQPAMDDAEGKNDMTSSTTAAVQNLTQEQEGTLVRSALRSSLDGEDAELLNEFLSKAKAKRAAKAAMMDAPDTDEKSSSPEESPEADTTPRSRRALGDLDTNSPSPVKVQGPPSKDDAAPDAEAGEELASKEPPDSEPAPASPVCRRSTRVKAQPPANGPARNTISLRRAKGTEFVFLQRTEAQELALATKRNTRRNKGSAVLPKFALETLAQQQREDGADNNDQTAQSERKGSGSRRAAGPRKQVAWNEERLVEYEGEIDEEEEEDDSSKNDVGASRLRSGTKRAKSTTSSRSSRSQQQKEDQEPSAGPDSGPTAQTTASTTASPRSARRVRRLGDLGMESGTPVKTGSARKPPAAAAESSAGPSTPPKARRKLIPKSPSSSLPVAKNSNTNTNEQPFVSGIPTRSTKSAEGNKRKNMLPSAGSTPMPRRMRSRT